MRGYVQPGNTIPLIAPSGGVTAGVGYVIGAIFAVAQNTAAQGESFEGVCAGVINLAKSGSLTFTQGEKVFWDNSAKALKKTSAGYFMIGTATIDIAAGDTVIPVRLDGNAVTAV